MIWLYDHPGAVIAAVTVLACATFVLVLLVRFDELGAHDPLEPWPKVEPGIGGPRHVRLIYSQVPFDWADQPDTEYLVDPDDGAA